MNAISSYRGNRPTHPQTNTPSHKQTGPITIHCAAASAQCNYCHGDAIPQIYHFFLKIQLQIIFLKVYFHARFCKFSSFLNIQARVLTVTTDDIKFLILSSISASILCRRQRHILNNSRKAALTLQLSTIWNALRSIRNSVDIV